MEELYFLEDLDGCVEVMRDNRRYGVWNEDRVVEVFRALVGGDAYLACLEYYVEIGTASMVTSLDRVENQRLKLTRFVDYHKVFFGEVTEIVAAFLPFVLSDSIVRGLCCFRFHKLSPKFAVLSSFSRACFYNFSYGCGSKESANHADFCRLLQTI